MIEHKIPVGYKEDVPDERDNVFGDAQTPTPVVLPSGNWREVSIVNEHQARANFDTYGCVSFSLLSAYEKLAKQLFKEDWNKADRFTYIASGTTPGVGNSPRVVADSIRHKGLVNENILPFDDSVKTLEEFNSPRPLTEYLLSIGLVFLENYEPRYDYLPQNNGEVTRATLREALKRSPIPIAVQAWSEQDGKFVRTGRDTHLTLLENVKENGELEVFDSYPPFQKTLVADFPIYTGLRVYLRKMDVVKENIVQQLSLYERVIELLSKWLGLVKEMEKKTIPPPPALPTPPKVKIGVEKWGKAVEQCEGYGTPRAVTINAFFNPGAIKGRDGKFLKFLSYEYGFAQLCDYLTRAATGKHGAYPKGGETTLQEFTKIYVGSDYNYSPKIAKFLNIKVETKIKEII